jgi:PST family polysaccharide transporter
MFLTTVCSVIGFLIAVHWGIVAIAVSFVIAGYLVAPVSYAALYRLIKVDIKTYLRQFLAPLLASLLMVAAIQGLKFIIEPQGLNIYLELSIYLSAGALTYLLVIILAARPLARQILDLVSMVLPKWLLRKTI